jgi:glycosyltransferase involved in cell wall biosynthesis
MAGNIAGDRQFPKLKALIADAKLDDSVILPGFIPDHDLLQLYPISSVFFFPSLYEGFGLPPLEAMAAGVPVVSSNTSCMPEVLGDAAVCVDPLDYDAAAQEMYGLLTDPQRRMLLKERGKERAAQFTWERTGELTMQAYERLARERTSPHP